VSVGALDSGKINVKVVVVGEENLADVVEGSSTLDRASVTDDQDTAVVQGGAGEAEAVSDAVVNLRGEAELAREQLENNLSMEEEGSAEAYLEETLVGEGLADALGIVNGTLGDNLAANIDDKVIDVNVTIVPLDGGAVGHVEGTSALDATRVEGHKSGDVDGLASGDDDRTTVDVDAREGNIGYRAQKRLATRRSTIRGRKRTLKGDGALVGADSVAAGEGGSRPDDVVEDGRTFELGNHYTE